MRVLQATDKPILKIYNRKFAQKKGSPVQGELSRLAVTEGLVLTIFLDRANPSVIFLRKCHLPLHRGGSKLVPFRYFDECFISKVLCQRAERSVLKDATHRYKSAIADLYHIELE